MVKPMTPEARRFRVIFWLVIAIGALPSLVSGLALRSSYRVETLCAAARPINGPAEVAVRLTWMRVHEWGAYGALLAALLVLGYTAAWLRASTLAPLGRALVAALLFGVLLPGLALAVWTGRALPWRLFGPTVWLGAAGEARSVGPGRSPEEEGGAAWCADHRRELAGLGRAYVAHLAGGALALAVTFSLGDLGARWRRDRNG